MARFRIGVTLRDADEAQVTLTGTVSQQEARRAHLLIDALVQAGARQLLVDLAQVDHCDHDLLVYLDELRRYLTGQGGWMIIDGFPDALRDDTTTLDDIFAVYRRVTALACSVPGRAPSPEVTPGAPAI